MNATDAKIEQEIQAKGLNAPRITPDHINNTIQDIEYLRPKCGVLTICVLTLANGFTVTGESACASPENFNEEIGRNIAFENARQKIWALEGYLLKQRLYEGKN
ncbi:Gp49 family protein [Acetobacter sp. A11-2]|uniref:Gp49 family protein n=1 Tax=Acetobacter sp. A11-2 TaxID=3157859 RepID=UPI0032F05ABB